MSFTTREPRKPIKILDEGITISPDVSQIDFQGAGVAITEDSGSQYNLVATIAGGSGGNFVKNELVGVGDGVTTVFSLAHTPLNGADIRRNGLTVNPGVGSDYTLATATITFAVAPEVGDIITAFYEW